MVHVRGVVTLGGVETSGACEGCGDTGWRGDQWYM